jgi:hypothetical protein
MEEALRTILLNTSAISQVVGSRISYGSAAQGAALPYIVLHVIDDAEEHTYQGPDGLSQGRVQVDCYGATYGQAKTLSRHVRAVLDGYRGGQFSGIFHASTRDNREGGANEFERPFTVQLDFLTKWRTPHDD